MIRSRIQNLEKKVKALGLAQKNYPESITIRVVGCSYPRPRKTVLSDTGAIPIYCLCKPGGGDCETCQYFDPERVRRDYEKRRKTA